MQFRLRRKTRKRDLVSIKEKSDNLSLLLQISLISGVSRYPCTPK